MQENIQEKINVPTKNTRNNKNKNFVSILVSDLSNLHHFFLSVF